MLTPEQLKSRMSTVLSLPVEKFSDEAVLQHLVVDSFILIDMVIDLQNTFRIRLDQEDLVEVRTVGDLIKVILSKNK